MFWAQGLALIAEAASCIADLLWAGPCCVSSLFLLHKKKAHALPWRHVLRRRPWQLAGVSRGVVCVCVCMYVGIYLCTCVWVYVFGVCMNVCM